VARRRFRRNWSHSDVSTLLDHQPWVYFSAAKRSRFRFGQKDSTIDGVLPVMLPWLQFEETASDPHVIGIGPRVSLPYEAIFDPHTMLPVDRVGLNPASFWRAVEDFTRDAGWNAQAELFVVSADSQAFLILDAQPNDFSYVSRIVRLGAIRSHRCHVSEVGARGS
jgi:hypothetical protein